MRLQASALEALWKSIFIDLNAVFFLNKTLRHNLGEDSSLSERGSMFRLRIPNAIQVVLAFLSRIALPRGEKEECSRRFFLVKTRKHVSAPDC